MPGLHRVLNLPEQFSKLNDTVAPLTILELFFDDVLVNMIAGYIKLYSHKEKADITFEYTNEKILSFLSMLLLNGCHNLPGHKIYWLSIPDTFM